MHDGIVVQQHMNSVNFNVLIVVILGKWFDVRWTGQKRLIKTFVSGSLRQLLPTYLFDLFYVALAVGKEFRFL